MAGQLWGMEGLEGLEVSGVYIGELQEDMIETVRRTGRPYVDALVGDLFSVEADYPLTYVPTVCMTLPLKKGAKVIVRFVQDNPMYPFLWKLGATFDEVGDFLDETFDLGNIGMVSGGLVDLPDLLPTVAVTKLSDECYVLVTDGYTLLHRGGQAVLLSDDSLVCSTDKMLVKTGMDGPVEVSAGGKLRLWSGSVGPSVSIGNEQKSLKDILEGIVNHIMVMQTAGSPVNHAVSPASVKDFMNDLMDIGQLFEE